MPVFLQKPYGVDAFLPDVGILPAGDYHFMYFLDDMDIMTSDRQNIAVMENWNFRGIKLNQPLPEYTAPFPHWEALEITSPKEIEFYNISSNIAIYKCDTLTRIFTTSYTVKTVMYKFEVGNYIIRCYGSSSITFSMRDAIYTNYTLGEAVELSMAADCESIWYKFTVPQFSAVKVAYSFTAAAGAYGVSNRYPTIVDGSWPHYLTDNSEIIIFQAGEYYIQIPANTFAVDWTLEIEIADGSAALYELGSPFNIEFTGDPDTDFAIGKIVLEEETTITITPQVYTGKFNFFMFYFIENADTKTGTVIQTIIRTLPAGTYFFYAVPNGSPSAGVGSVVISG
jgi:hypothetical protein